MDRSKQTAAGGAAAPLVAATMKMTPGTSTGRLRPRPQRM